MSPEAPESSPTFDLRGASDNEIAAFVFDHPVTDQVTSWWWDLDFPQVLVEPREIAAFLARLFTYPEPLRERYAPDQVDQGFWLMFSAALESEFAAVLWDAAVPWEERRACIAALPELYGRLFEPMLADLADYGASSMFMLPDFLAFPYDLGSRRRDDEVEGQVQDALLDAFARMLASPSEETCIAALHGLGHLHHPDGPAVIRAFLDSRPVDPDLRHYAELAILGDVL